MGRLKTGLKLVLKNLSGKEVDGATLSEVVDNFNLQYETVELSVNVVDELGEPVLTPTIVLKTGSTQGSGTSVNANGDGTYNVKYGSYNISVAKTNFTTATLVFSVDYADATLKEKDITITLEAS